MLRADVDTYVAHFTSLFRFVFKLECACSYFSSENQANKCQYFYTYISFKTSEKTRFQEKYFKHLNACVEEHTALYMQNTEYLLHIQVQTINAFYITALAMYVCYFFWEKRRKTVFCV